LPMGLGVFRQAMDTSVSSTIVQRIVNDAQQTDFDELIKTIGGAEEIYYFDDEGALLEEADRGRSLYTVLREVDNTMTLPSVGASTGFPASGDLAKITVTVVTNPAHAKDVFVATSNLPRSTNSALVARNKTSF
jgi:uncharacterized protein (TIGR02598 family)